MQYFALRAKAGARMLKAIHARENRRSADDKCAKSL